MQDGINAHFVIVECYEDYDVCYVKTTKKKLPAEIFSYLSLLFCFHQKCVFCMYRSVVENAVKDREQKWK